MTILEALQTALAALEKEGYRSGDIHDDLVLVIDHLTIKYPKITKEKLR